MIFINISDPKCRHIVDKSFYIEVIISDHKTVGYLQITMTIRSGGPHFEVLKYFGRGSQTSCKICDF